MSPNVARLAAAVRSAEGPSKYVALRTLWSEWDAGDPDEIEEALLEASSDDAEPPPIRTYAALLEGYARRRRGDLKGARERVAQLGFVDRWLLVGPFDNDGKAGLDTTFEPEGKLLEPLSLTDEFEAKDHRHVRWRALPGVSPYGWTDLGSFVRPSEDVCVYATTFVRDPRSTKAVSVPATIWLGAEGAFRLFWNGRPVLADERYRDLDSDRFAQAVSVRYGWNRLTVKVCGDDRSPMVSVRIAEPDGSPNRHVQVEADVSHGSEPALADGALARPGPRGPMQEFEQEAKGQSPRELEDFARYLQTTGADDPTEHRARELARKAAEEAPTVPRLLLAAGAAESRNQRGSWIDRAEAFVTAHPASRQDSIDVILARAGYLREGVNPRSALPYYERALSLDADCVQATLGKAELYQDVGMHDTALALLQRALARRPHDVELLRATTAALRDDGRETESDEMAERYAAVRFDDPSFVRAHIDLAVARLDHRAAEHWMDRLLESNPGSIASLQTVGQAWLRLGDREKAIAAYRNALEYAPDDTDTLRQLATIYGSSGDRDERLRLLQRALALAPQAKDVRDELLHLGPLTVRSDQEYARPSSDFLALRSSPAEGQARRSLVDLQVTTVLPSGLASRFRQIVIQPLTQPAAEAAREFDFTYEADSDVVQLCVARVYRADGRIEEAVDSGAGPMADDPALAIYTSERSYYVRFPRLEPGDVVELQYRVDDVSARNEFADYFGEIVTLQGTEPISRSEYILVTPRSRAFYFNEPRVPGLERRVEERGDQRVFRFLAKNVRPITEEPSQPPWPEVLGHVNVSTYRDWHDMGRWYWGLVKDQLLADDEVRRRAEALTKGLTDIDAKVRAIYDYVVQGTRYVALEFGIHGYKPYRSAQIFARGFGDCKDKATLLVTMLGALGIEATPVIVRTGNKGDIETVPASLAPFDHMIAYVPSLDLYLDGTAEYSGSRELPAMDRGALALQVNRGNAKLVHLPDPPAEASTTTQRVNATLGRDGSAQIEWSVGISGVEAPEWRARFHAKATLQERVTQLLTSFLPETTVSSVDPGHLDDVETPVTLRALGKTPAFARIEGAELVVPVEPAEHMVRELASAPTRSLDVRLFARWTREDDWTIRLPDGSHATTIPPSAKGSGPFGSYSVDVAVSDGSIEVKTTVTSSVTRVTAADYPAFRAWCQEVDRALGHRARVTVQ